MEKNWNDEEMVNISIGVKKRIAVPKIWTALSKARKVFSVQLTKSNDVKLHCINNEISGLFPDVERFWSDYLTQAERLLDSRKYLKECETLDVSAQNLAQHIVFLGSAMINKVLKNGIESTIGKDYKFYTENLVKPEISNFFRNEVEELPH